MPGLGGGDDGQMHHSRPLLVRAAAASERIPAACSQCSAGMLCHMHCTIGGTLLDKRAAWASKRIPAHSAGDGNLELQYVGHHLQMTARMLRCCSLTWGPACAGRCCNVWNKCSSLTCSRTGKGCEVVDVCHPLGTGLLP